MRSTNQFIQPANFHNDLVLVFDCFFFQHKRPSEMDNQMFAQQERRLDTQAFATQQSDPIDGSEIVRSLYQYLS